MNNSACPEVLEEVAALPAALLMRLADAREGREYSQFAAELSPETLRHLPTCDFCRAEIALLAGATATLGALPAPALPPDFAARIHHAIAAVPQDEIVAPEGFAATETPREYSQVSPELALPEDAPTMIAPPLPRAAKRGWRARFGLEKIGGAPRRNLKIAWASGSVLAAFVLVLATQIEPPSTLVPHSNSAIRESAPAPASTRKNAFDAQRDAAKAKSGATASPQMSRNANTNATAQKPNTPDIRNAAPKIAPATSHNTAPPQNAPLPDSEFAAPPLASGNTSTPRESIARPLQSPQRAVPQPQPQPQSNAIAQAENHAAPEPRASKIVTPPKAQGATRKNSPAFDGTPRGAPAKRDSAPRVLAAPAPQIAPAARSAQTPGAATNNVPRDDRASSQIGVLKNRVAAPDAATQRDDKPRARSNMRRENSAPPAAVSGALENRETSAPSESASTRDAAPSAQKMRGTAADESRAAAPDISDNAGAAASGAVPAPPATNARSGAFSAPAPVAQSRAENAPIPLRIMLAAPRDARTARLRLELPSDAKLQNETPGNVIWRGALQRGASAIADVKIIEEKAVSSRRAHAVLETRERGTWRILATKDIVWDAP